MSLLTNSFENRIVPIKNIENSKLKQKLYHTQKPSFIQSYIFNIHWNKNIYIYIYSVCISAIHDGWWSRPSVPQWRRIRISRIVQQDLGFPSTIQESRVESGDTIGILDKWFCSWNKMRIVSFLSWSLCCYHIWISHENQFEIKFLKNVNFDFLSIKKMQ